MANAVAVRSYGDQYQALVFWKYALDMLKKDSDIENIGYVLKINGVVMLMD